MNKWNNKKTEELIDAVLSLKNANEARRFFRDLLTEEEIVEFTKRWQAAKMLNAGMSYTIIEKETGLSSTTVARVAKWLNDGMGGYKLIINRINSHHKKSSLGKGLS